MKIKTTQEVEYWLTRTRAGKLIRVYRIDAQEPHTARQYKMNPFDIPIMVESTGIAEGIADILEEREKLRGEVEHYSNQLLKERRERYEEQRRESKKKKWYQFWK